MEIVRTEGCTCYGTTVDGESVQDLSLHELKNVFSRLLANVDDDTAKQQVIEAINNFVAAMGDYEQLYTCEECGDSVEEFRYKTKY